jgi:hypothetical protein
LSSGRLHLLLSRTNGLGRVNTLYELLMKTMSSSSSDNHRASIFLDFDLSTDSVDVIHLIYVHNLTKGVGTGGNTTRLCRHYRTTDGAGDHLASTEVVRGIVVTMSGGHGGEGSEALHAGTGTLKRLLVITIITFFNRALFEAIE